ncbi:MAG: IS1595 family transposase [Rhodobacteraceae bacterium]|nr:IS1595 family transposase [Paracoccaceae bacterium]
MTTVNEKPSSKSPGKSHRTGITLMQLADMFPDEDTARLWFESRVWPHGRHCPHCGSLETYAASHPKSPYRCKDCRRYFSVKTGTALENSRIPLRKWAFAIYLETTHVKGIASMKLHRDLGVTQKTAWFMLHRIRQAWSEVADSLDGTIEADEAYFGGLEKNKHKAKKLNAGRGGVGKAKAVALRERETNKIVAKVVDRLDRKTLQGLVTDNVKEGSTVYTDGNTAYGKIEGYAQDAVNHSVGQYVRNQAHTNGVESFWALLKRAHTGTYHKMSKKHLNRYVQSFAGKHNRRDLDTIDQMDAIVADLIGRKLLYRDLTA